MLQSMLQNILYDFQGHHLQKVKWIQIGGSCFNIDLEIYFVSSRKNM